MLNAASLLHWLRGAMARDEAARGARFDLVAFARPDVLLHAPVRPWCSWESSRTPLLCFPRLHQAELLDVHADSLWVAPRALFVDALSQQVGRQVALELMRGEQRVGAQCVVESMQQ